MYDSGIMVDRIKEVARKKGVRLKDMLPACGLGINALNQVKPGAEFSAMSLSAIADYLDVSVDHLLGNIEERWPPSMASNEETPAEAGAGWCPERKALEDFIAGFSADEIRRVHEIARYVHSQRGEEL